MSIQIDMNLCQRCGHCEPVCVARVFRSSEDGSPKIQEERLKSCIHCGQCAAVCPAGAITADGIDPATLTPVTSAPFNDTQREMLFRGRRSVRAYEPRPVARELLEEAMDLAANAPTARHVREVCWTVINGREKLLPLIKQTARILEASRKPNYAGIEKSVEKGNDPIFRGAPCLVLAHCEPWRWAETDCAIAVTYMELALHSLGLGTCWCGMLINAALMNHQDQLPLNKIGGGRSWRGNVIDAAMHKAPANPLDLHLPEGHELYAGLMVGYPAFGYARLPLRKPTEITWL
ncbi:MAG: nitroreductase family protein [Desulfovibrionaceae bacterium]|nr:nitroreductase family protein [Desulfovibrionaceae bacterium]MBR5734779.1 nitroreductase family protein [Desulfovibrionaceae bacterium]